MSANNKDKKDAEPHRVPFDVYVQALCTTQAPDAQLLGLFKHTVHKELECGYKTITWATNEMVSE